MLKSNAFVVFCGCLLTLNVKVTDSRDFLDDAKFIRGLFKEAVDYATYIDFTHHPHRTDPEHRATTYDLIKEEGYVAETHIVPTEDRYLLTVHRIPRSNFQQPEANKPVVILIHGWVSSSAFWLLNGNTSLGFLLANAGYDVWLPNMRGNSYSRRHEFLDPDKDASRFWDFSFHEMGYYDMPAIIDYILAATGQQQLYYIGHSTGTTISYVLTSARPEYNSKIKAVFSLAPLAYLGNAESPLHVIYEYVVPKLVNSFLDSDLYELFPMNKWIGLIDKYICNNYTITSTICEETIGRIIGIDQSQMPKGFLQMFLKHFPAGSSIKVSQHFSQLYRERRFNQFNYGTVDNYVHYKHIFPPDYQLQNATVPILMFFGKDDYISVKQDVDVLFDDLPHIVAKIIVKYDKFNHLDFLFAKDAKVLLYDYLIEILNRYRDGGHVDREYLKQFKTLAVT